MFLEEIKLHNYRPYYGDQEISLGYNKESNVNVIYANNARGKSSLLNAITWAFYGKELHDEGVRANPIYNKIAAQECDKGLTFDVSVSLTLFDVDESGNKIPFKVERSETYFKDSKGNIEFEKQELNILDFDGEWYEDQVKIDAVISKVMHKYFFFNGEQLDDYFNKNDIKKTIERISQIDLISTVNDHLNYVNSKYNNDITNLDDDLKPVTDKLNEAQQSLNELKTKETKTKGDIEDLEGLIDKCDETLDDLKEAKELSNERNELLEENSKIEGRLSENEPKYANNVVELYSIVNLFDPLYEIATFESEDDDIEKSSDDLLFSKKMIEIYEYILKEDVCICGVDFNENPEHRDEIQEKLDKLYEISGGSIEEDDDLLQDVIDDVRSILKTIKNKYEFINTLRESITTDSENLEKNNERLLEISNSLTEADDDDITDTENIRKTTQESLDKKKNKLKKIIGDIAVEENKVKHLTKKRDKILENIDESNILKNELKFCERAVDIISDLNENLKADILDKISNEINSQVSSRDFSEEGYGDVTIDNKFNVSLKDFMRDPIFPDDLSGGQRRSLALAFIIALNNIGGFDLPLFIDAPFSTLDDEHIQFFIDNLPKFTKSKQLVFLFIEDHYNKGIEDMLKPYINKKINLIKVAEYKTEVSQ